jgi:putative ABC transport system permease protein
LIRAELLKPHLWLIRFIGIIVPRAVRADWLLEWEGELRHREKLLQEWDRLDWHHKFELVMRSTSAFWDALWMQSYRWETDMFQDLRFGLRMLIKQPGFAFISVLTLALGIGANTAIFSVVNGLLLRPLPYFESDRLVLVSERSRDGQRLEAAYPNFVDWQERAQSFVGMAAAHTANLNLTGVEKSARLEGWVGTWNFFPLLGVNPQLGRLFNEADDHLGAPRTVVLSNEFWHKQFGADSSVINQSLWLDGNPYTVIGVLPRGFEYLEKADVYLPIGISLTPDSPMLGRGNSTDLYAVARLKPGATVEQANNEMTAIGNQLAQEYPKVNEGKSAMAERLQDVMSEQVRQSLWVLFGAVGFILLIACINVANLLLVRGAERQKELALRLALGAGRGRIVRQLLSESLLIAFLGGGCGLLVGFWMLQGLLSLAPADIPQLSRVGLDLTVMLFTVAISVVTSVLCGLLPASQSAKTDLQTALKAGGRLTGSRREGMRKALLIAEVSLSLVLLVGAGLLLRSMYNLLHVDLGFDGRNLLTMRIRLSGEKYDSKTRRIFYEECLRNVEAVPGVDSAALTMSLPIRGSNWGSVFMAVDKPVTNAAELPHSDYIRISRNYFDTMGMKIVRGRSFSAADTPDSPLVAVINETLARQIWPGEDPVGKQIRQGQLQDESRRLEVIGVVNDVKLNGVDQETSMQTYILYDQAPSTGLGVVVRAKYDPLAVAPSVERAIHEIDRDLPLFSISTMDQMLHDSLSQRRLTLVLLGSFAALALILAAIGIYGVISYAVRQRTHELGIRLALGAQPRNLLTMILRQGLTLSLAGVLVGLGAAVALTRLMKSLLFGVQPIDNLTFGMIAGVLLLVAALACWIPARRATRVDPMIALRNE